MSKRDEIKAELARFERMVKHDVAAGRMTRAQAQRELSAAERRAAAALRKLPPAPAAAPPPARNPHYKPSKPKAAPPPAVVRGRRV